MPETAGASVPELWLSLPDVCVVEAWRLTLTLKIKLVSSRAWSLRAGPSTKLEYKPWAAFKITEAWLVAVLKSQVYRLLHSISCARWRTEWSWCVPRAHVKCPRGCYAIKIYFNNAWNIHNNTNLPQNTNNTNKNRTWKKLKILSQCSKIIFASRRNAAASALQMLYWIMVFCM